jgi:hypothetical protein
VNGECSAEPDWDGVTGESPEVLDAPGAPRGGGAGAWIVGVVKCVWKVAGLPHKSQAPRPSPRAPLSVRPAPAPSRRIPPRSDVSG